MRTILIPGPNYYAIGIDGRYIYVAVFYAHFFKYAAFVIRLFNKVRLEIKLNVY